MQSILAISLLALTAAAAPTLLPRGDHVQFIGYTDINYGGEQWESPVYYSNTCAKLPYPLINSAIGFRSIKVFTSSGAGGVTLYHDENHSPEALVPLHLAAPGASDRVHSPGVNTFHSYNNQFKSFCAFIH